MKSFLQNNIIEMYSTHNEKKSVFVERFIRTLKNKIYKNMTSISNNDIVNKYNNTYHKTIKMKPVNVNSNTYTNSRKEINDKDPKSKIGDFGRISKYKNILQNVTLQSGLKKFF